jgi:two-component system, OmpR family, sensor histidine kinase KdpD
MKWAGYAWALGATAACTLVGFAVTPHTDLVNLALLYLLAVVGIALRFGRGPVVAASILGVAAFDYFFVVPSGTFHVDDPQYLLTFGMMLAVGLTISRLTQTVRARAHAQADLAIQAETERIRNALLSSISHDLRTPLAVIAGASSSLAEGGERMAADERRALAQSIYRESQAMSELVAKVLQMTRLESGGLKLERDWCSIGEIAASVVRRLKPRLADHLIMVDMPGDLPLARVDGALLEQARAHLLENAARHTPPRTLVRLRAHVHANELVVSVEDFGPGLPEGDLEHLFEKFRHDGRRGGVGLGLAICRAIIALHGGRIWAERLPGVGTAFRFALPLEPSPVMPAEALAE